MQSGHFIQGGQQVGTQEIAVSELETEELHHLIVWNDDVNTFDWVIESLIDICDHEVVQAEQCALIIHHNGKCSVKKGDFTTLKPQAEALIERGISATIDY